MTTPASSYPFDARALTGPIDVAALRAFRKSSRKDATASPASVAVVVASATIFVVAIFIFGVALTGIAHSVAPAAGGAIIVGVLAVFTVIAVVFWALTRAHSVKRYRLDTFARANAMTYTPIVRAPQLPGMIFSIGSGRNAADVIRGQSPRFVEFANYRYTSGSGKEQQTHRWGYIAIKLSSSLPHIVLDSAGNNGVFGGSNLPATFGKDQQLHLEGDFDRYFTLYCPQGYERDALYLFTPDIMARFIDEAAALDVEIIDDWLFFYAQRDFSTLDPATWAWLFGVVSAVTTKLGQWDRWRDDHLTHTSSSATAPPNPFAALPSPGVAPQGQRLKRRVPWLAIALLAVFFAAALAIQSGLFAGLGGVMTP